jgi:predicted transposase/invertase (TIGR01784 family)
MTQRPRRPRARPLHDDRHLWLTPTVPGARPRFLKPRLDPVFKMLLTEEHQRPFLLFLLTAVIEFASPIASVRILPPELSRRSARERSGIVDVLVGLEDGRTVVVEMQNRRLRDFRSRSVMYSTRTHGRGHRAGEPHGAASKTVLIGFLGYREFDDEHVRHTVMLHTVQTNELYADDLRMEFFELEKFRSARGDAAHAASTLSRAEERLLTFLSATSEEELEALVEEHPEMRQAAKNLQDFSAKADRRLLADLRRIDRFFDEREAYAEQLEREAALTSARAEGEARGRAEGEARGRLETALMAAAAMLELGVPRAAIEAKLGVVLAELGL